MKIIKWLLIKDYFPRWATIIIMIPMITHLLFGVWTLSDLIKLFWK